VAEGTALRDSPFRLPAQFHRRLVVDEMYHMLAGTNNTPQNPTHIVRGVQRKFMWMFSRMLFHLSTAGSVLTEPWPAIVDGVELEEC